jgi:uracil-DNA glycosylase family 4
MPSKALDEAARAIVACDACARLRTYCQSIARQKRAAYRDEVYWGRPVPGFGDPNARIVLIGLAPAAHGANRTGRVFTGDGAGGSGDFLMAALHANGLANQPFSRAADDGLQLYDVWIAAAVRCAPPDNKPTPAEVAACHAHLRAELDALPNACVYVGLGRLAFDRCRQLLVERGTQWRTKPTFSHGAVFRTPGAPTIIASYHPSRQNTQTGRLTQAMLRRALSLAGRERLERLRRVAPLLEKTHAAEQDVGQPEDER